MRRPAAGIVLVNVLFAAASLAAATTAFWPIYRSGAFLLMAAVTIVVGLLIALCGALFRWSSIVVAAVAAAAYLLLGVPLAVPGEVIAGVFPSTAGFLELLSATALGWKRLVTISVPVGSYQALLVPAFLLILLAALLTLTLALRAKHRELAVLPPIGLFVAGIALGPSVATAPVATVLALLVVLLFWLIWFRWRRRSASIGVLTENSGVAVETPRERRFTGARTVFGAAVILAIAAVAGTAATAALPPQVSRDVVRSRVAQPFDPRDYPSPLSGFRNYLEPDAADTPMLTVSGLAADRRIRIATLDAYDGVVYSVGNGTAQDPSDSFTRVPFRLDQNGVGGTDATLDVTVRGYSGVWVPGDGQLTQLSFTGKDADKLGNAFYYNDTTGTAAVTTALHSGDRYRLDAVVKPEWTADQLGSASPGSATLPKVQVVPDELDSVLQSYTQGASTPGAKLEAALKGLAKDGYISHGIGDEPASRSGHGADRITQLLTDVPMLGDQEQYAVTAALMARELGFPARVVIGFAAGADSPKTGPVTFTGADISAWIEVQTRSAGWVTVDPTPPVRDIPAKKPDTPTQISRPQTVVQPPQDNTIRQPDESPQSHVDNRHDAHPNAFLGFLLVALGILGWVVLGLAIVAAPFVAIIAAKLRRRTLRRSAETSIEKIAGGWREFQDTATDWGYQPPASATRTEVAEAVGGMPALVLASVADRAVFSPAPPTPADADSVWRAVQELKRTLRAGRSRWQRFLAAVSLRSFGVSLGVYRGKDERAKGGR